MRSKRRRQPHHTARRFAEAGRRGRGGMNCRATVRRYAFEESTGYRPCSDHPPSLVESGDAGVAVILLVARKNRGPSRGRRLGGWVGEANRGKDNLDHQPADLLAIRQNGLTVWLICRHSRSEFREPVSSPSRGPALTSGGGISRGCLAGGSAAPHGVGGPSRAAMRVSDPSLDFGLGPRNTLRAKHDRLRESTLAMRS